MFKMRKLLQGDPGEGSTAIALLEPTSIDRLEETALKKHRPAAEVRDALMKRVARASVDEFETLKRTLFMHFPN
jgi:hypothetical protein